MAAADNQPQPAHDQTVTHRWLIHYPAHPARTSDPHYVDFDHYHRKTRGAARCYIGERVGFQDCKDAQGQPAVIDTDGRQSGLELHHAHIEFALQNAVNLAALARDYPGIDNPDEVGAWVESETNFRWLCVWHHRGLAGAHSVSHADYEASQYIQGLVGEPAPKERP